VLRRQVQSNGKKHAVDRPYVPVPVLKIVFRAKVRDGLKRLFQRAGLGLYLIFYGKLIPLDRPT
jgi:hypothetical protein